MVTVTALVSKTMSGTLGAQIVELIHRALCLKFYVTKAKLFSYSRNTDVANKLDTWLAQHTYLCIYDLATLCRM